MNGIESRDSLNRELEQCPPDALRLILRDVCDRNHDVAEALHKALCIDKPSSLPIQSPAPPTKHVTPVVDLTEAPSPATSQLSEGAHSASKKRKTLDEVVNNTIATAPRSKKSKAKDETSWRDKCVHFVHCYELFDVMDSDDDEACYYHDGTNEVDRASSQWDDHDEDRHGTIDSLELRGLYSQGYIRDCCDQRGEAEGCKHGPHQPGSVLKHHAQIKKA